MPAATEGVCGEAVAGSFIGLAKLEGLNLEVVDTILV
jgi:hypothetical protein